MLTAGCGAAAPRIAASHEHDAAPASPVQEQAGAVLAFDFGLRRIGVAVGDLALGIAHPLATIAAEDNARRFAAIDKLVAEWRPVRFVLGHPQGARTVQHPLAAALERFQRRLAGRFGLPVERVDEALSSWDASRRMSAGGVPARAQKGRLDAAAACVILETWFEQRRAQAPAGRGGCA